MKISIHVKKSVGKKVEVQQDQIDDFMVLCVGSINIDDVYSVPHIVNPGETISSVSVNSQGANQSVALALAGAKVAHLGKIGHDGDWIKKLMASYGVQTDLIHVDDQARTGKAIIQVASNGENSIILSPGSNHSISLSAISKAFSTNASFNWLLLQNEINIDAAIHAINQSRQTSNVIVCLNPSPFPASLKNWMPVNLVDILLLNDTECSELSFQYNGHQQDDPETHLKNIMLNLPTVSIVVVTLGGNGVIFGIKSPNTKFPLILNVPVIRAVKVVDTTGAGDTFTGYFVSSLQSLSRDVLEMEINTNQPAIFFRVLNAVQIAIKASGLCCEQHGAMVSIPQINNVLYSQ
ncbi:hypothetical protein HDV02_004047 [Globomyces sp. JEL0801]|nr:hypothetical protein HDV02_004047 [Globomyces sp. JEL0801]